MSSVSLKRRIGITLNKLGPVYSIMVKANLMLFHSNMKMKKQHYGEEDKGTTYYVIRPNGYTEGLLSSYFSVVEHVLWSYKKGFRPVVDFSSHDCQYYCEREINGTKNAWEYFFEQPEGLSAGYVKNKANVILSGWTLFEKNSIPGIARDFTIVDNEKVRKLCTEKLKVNTTVTDQVKKQKELLFKDKTILGIYARGTDYVSLCPKGHCRQPEIEQIIAKAKQFVDSYPIDGVFVCTEDEAYYKKIVEEIGENMVFTLGDYFAREFDKDNYLADSWKDDPYTRGMNYLVKILLLNECDYLVAGVTNGSVFARLLKEKPFKEEYWFDLGKY